MSNVQRMHELTRKHTKAQLLDMAFAGGLVDFNSPAQWRKDEIAAVVAEQEERRARQDEMPVGPPSDLLCGMQGSDRNGAPVDCRKNAGHVQAGDPWHDMHPTG